MLSKTSSNQPQRQQEESTTLQNDHRATGDLTEPTDRDRQPTCVLALAEFFNSSLKCIMKGVLNQNSQYTSKLTDRFNLDASTIRHFQLHRSPKVRAVNR